MKKTACMNELMQGKTIQDLYGWSTRQAAEDINHFSKIYRKQEFLQPENKKIAVYGVSYGTYLLNKLLNLYPDSVDAAIADSMVFFFAFFDKFVHTVNFLKKMINYS